MGPHKPLVKVLSLSNLSILLGGCRSQLMQASYRTTEAITRNTMLRKTSPPCSSAQLFRAPLSFFGVVVVPSSIGRSACSAMVWLLSLSEEGVPSGRIRLRTTRVPSRVSVSCHREGNSDGSDRRTKDLGGEALCEAEARPWGIAARLRQSGAEQGRFKPYGIGGRAAVRHASLAGGACRERRGSRQGSVHTPQGPRDCFRIGERPGGLKAQTDQGHEGQKKKKPTFQ